MGFPREGVALLAALAAACASGAQGPPAAKIAWSLPRPSMGPDAPTGFEVPVSARALERERCIDRELELRNLDPYGEPAGSQGGGAPTPGLRKGEDRYASVTRKRPDIGTACTRAPGEPEP